MNHWVENVQQVFGFYTYRGDLFVIGAEVQTDVKKTINSSNVIEKVCKYGIFV